jgi:hypothetical protein
MDAEPPPPEPDELEADGLELDPLLLLLLPLEPHAANPSDAATASARALRRFVLITSPSLDVVGAFSADRDVQLLTS